MKLIETWECQYMAERKTNPDLSNWINSKPVLHPGFRLQAREAVRGGITEIYIPGKWRNDEEETFFVDDMV